MRHLARHLATGAGLAALLVVALLRLPPLAAGEPRTARNELRWYGWAVRHPKVAGMLDAAPLAAAPGTRVLWVVPRGVDRRWFEVRALYRLPGTWPAAVVERGDALPAAGWELRVDLYPGGRVVASPAGSSAGAGSPAPGNRS